MFLKKIIWAIDPFEPDKKLNQNTAYILNALAKRTGAVVEPVHILNISQLNYSNEIPRAWLSQFKPAVYKAMQEVLAEVHSIITTEEPRILVDSSTSVLGSSELLSNYAMSSEAGLIAVGTHGRSGVRRFFLGSFAESLLMRSWVPVLVAGYRSRQPDSLTQVMFPTQLSSSSRFAFREAVKIAKGLNARLTVFHCSTHSVEPILQSGVSLLGGTWLPLYPYFGHERNQILRRASVWTRWAKKQNVSVEMIIQARGEPITTSILTVANQKRTELIVMESHSGPVAAALTGSIARQVIRHAPCGIWILKPQEFLERELRPSLEPTPSAA